MEVLYIRGFARSRVLIGWAHGDMILLSRTIWSHRTLPSPRRRGWLHAGAAAAAALFAAIIAIVVFLKVVLWVSEQENSAEPKCGSVEAHEQKQ